MIVSGLSPAGMASLTGFERLWRSSRSHAVSVSAATATRQLARKSEDIEHASRRRLVRQVLDGMDEAQRRRRIARVELARDDRAGPAADPRDHRDILTPVRAAVADRLADDPAAGLELPQELAVALVDRFEPTVHRPVEDEPPGGRQRRAPQRQVFLDFPQLAAVDRVPCGEDAAVAARPGVHLP